MQKYNAKDIAEQRISFKGLTKTQFKKLLTHFQKYYNINEQYNYEAYHRHFRFYKDRISEDYIGASSVSYLCTIPRMQSNLEISYEEFDFEDEFVLPEYWHVVVTKENIDILSKWIGYRLEFHQIVGINRWNRDGHIRFQKGHNPSGVINNNEGRGTYDFGKEITFEQFKQYVLMEKEIIGYKLKEEYSNLRRVISLIIEPVRRDSMLSIGELEDILSLPNCVGVLKLRNAKVLDLWFEPVYKSNEEIYNMGAFNLTIRDKKVFHKNENITQFVIDIIDKYPLGKTFSSEVTHPYTIKEIIFSQTGCENNETKLSDWINVYNKIK